LDRARRQMFQARCDLSDAARLRSGRREFLVRHQRLLRDPDRDHAMISRLVARVVRGSELVAGVGESRGVI
jgi:hypothetical protein